MSTWVRSGTQCRETRSTRTCPSVRGWRFCIDCATGGWSWMTLLTSSGYALNHITHTQPPPSHHTPSPSHTSLSHTQPLPSHHTSSTITHLIVTHSATSLTITHLTVTLSHLPHHHTPSPSHSATSLTPHCHSATPSQPPSYHAPSPSHTPHHTLATPSLYTPTATHPLIPLQLVSQNCMC